MLDIKKLLKRGNIAITRNTHIFKTKDINPLSLDADLRCAYMSSRFNASQWDIMVIKNKKGEVLYRREYEDCGGAIPC